MDEARRSKLAERLNACVEDARRPIYNTDNGCMIPLDPRAVALVYAIEAIAAALTLDQSATQPDHFAGAGNMVQTEGAAE